MATEKYLAIKDYMEIGINLKPGTRVRVNHNTTECSGHSKSLVISKEMSGVIKASCFRCGKYGIYSSAKETALPTRNTSGEWSKVVYTSSVEKGKLKLPMHTSFLFNQWPAKAKLFFTSAGLDSDACALHKFGYNSELRKVVMPVFRDGEMIAYQLRRLFPDDPSPKYIQRASVKDVYKLFTGASCTEALPGAAKVCVLTEDLLSAIRVNKFLPSMCLFGTELSHQMIKALKDFDTILIYLDNDNSIVKKKQTTIHQQLELWIDNVVTIKATKQPKELEDTALRAALSLILGDKEVAGEA